MSNRNHATLCSANVKYLARNIVTLSKQKGSVSIKDLKTIWPRNFLTYTDQSGRSRLIKDDIVLLSGSTGSGKTILGLNMVTMNRPFTYTDSDVKATLPKVIPDGSVIIHDELSLYKPEAIEYALNMGETVPGSQVILISHGSLLQNEVVSRFRHKNQDISLICMDNFYNADKRSWNYFNVKGTKHHGIAVAEHTDNAQKHVALMPGQFVSRSIMRGDEDHASIPDQHLSLTNDSYKIISSSFHMGIKHHETLNIVARVAGYRDWHSLNGAFKNLSRDADISLTQKQPHDMM